MHGYKLGMPRVALWLHHAINCVYSGHSDLTLGTSWNQCLPLVKVVVKIKHVHAAEQAMSSFTCAECLSDALPARLVSAACIDGQDLVTVMVVHTACSFKY